MGRHSAPETSHRRPGSAPTQVALAALAVVALVVLFGTLLGPDETVSGTLTGTQAGGQEPHGAAPPLPTDEPSTAATEPPAVTDGAAPDPSGPMDAPENLGVDEDESTSTSPESAEDSADTTAPTTAAPPPADDSDTSAPPTVRFVSCAEAKAAGASMIPYADSRYSPDLDHDGDGVACDRRGDPPTRYNPPPTTGPCEPPG